MEQFVFDSIILGRLEMVAVARISRTCPRSKRQYDFFTKALPSVPEGLMGTLWALSRPVRVVGPQFILRYRRSKSHDNALMFPQLFSILSYRIRLVTGVVCRIVSESLCYRLRKVEGNSHFWVGRGEGVEDNML
jgi:hypothetical protein